MEENKYYIPEANELHIGFTYEFRPRLRQGIMSYVSQKFEYVDWWKTQEIGKGPENLIDALNDYNDPFSIDDVMSFRKDGMIRVKYLDKKDLIELGFEEDSFWSRESVDNPDKSYSMNNNRHIVFRHEFNKGKYCIYDYSRKINDQRLFEGYIKNKSELIKVLKMLGIK